jgi:hypothetical protein
MSDLAPFVAAALRDKVVTDLCSEIEELKLELEGQRTQSQLVTITGPRGNPVYAQALFRSGNYDYSPELWKVEFTDFQNNYCSLCDFSNMEVRLGGICKARLGENTEAFVNDVLNNYDHDRKSGAVSIWFGGSSGIWLNIRINNIEKQNYAALRDFDLSGSDLLETMLQFCNPETQVTFTEASFLISHINDAMEHWGIPSKPDD